MIQNVMSGEGEKAHPPGHCNTLATDEGTRLPGKDTQLPYTVALHAQPGGGPFGFFDPATHTKKKIECRGCVVLC